MTEKDRIRVKAAALSTLAIDTTDTGYQQVANALADCEKSLRRVAKRAEELSGEWERIEIKQMRGPAVEFTGRLLCDTQFTTQGRGQLEMTLEIWETRGGALVAVSASTLPGGSGREDERATVVPASDDIQAMRFAVMDAFTWQTEAKKMVRKKLGWDLRIEVD